MRKEETERRNTYLLKMLSGKRQHNKAVTMIKKEPVILNFKYTILQDIGSKKKRKDCVRFSLLIKK